MTEEKIGNREIVIGILGLILAVFGFGGMFATFLWGLLHNWEMIPYWWLSIPPFVVSVIIFGWLNKKISVSIDARRTEKCPKSPQDSESR